MTNRKPIFFHLTLSGKHDIQNADNRSLIFLPHCLKTRSMDYSRLSLFYQKISPVGCPTIFFKEFCQKISDSENHLAE